MFLLVGTLAAEAFLFACRRPASLSGNWRASIFPTRKFRGWRRALKADENFAPTAGDAKSARRWIMAELHLLALTPLFAALMARGVGG